MALRVLRLGIMMFVPMTVLGVAVRKWGRATQRAKLSWCRGRALR